MPRTREIRPAFFQDEDLATLSRDHRLLFQALWTLADREGRLEDRPAWIKLYSFPFDSDIAPTDISRMLDELASNSGKFILRYQVGEKGYLLITNFKKHQHVHPKEADSELPAPEELSERPRPIVTYFIRCGGSGPIKIGKTNQLAARISNMQSGAPDKLELLCTVEGDIEAECHKRFTSLRANGEWFNPGKELLDFISGIVASGKSRKVQENPVPAMEGSNFSPLPSIPSLPSLPSEPARDLAHARDPGTAEFALPAHAPVRSEPGKPSADTVLSTFSAIRAKTCATKALFWRPTPTALEKCAAMLATMDRDEVADIEPVIQLACEHARDGIEDWTDNRMRDPNFLWGTIAARWTALREELHGLSPPAPPSKADRKTNEQRTVIENWRPRDERERQAK